MQERLATTEEFLGRFPVVPFDAAAGTHFDRLVRSKAVRKVGPADLFIACIALAHRAILVTRNIKDFAVIPDLLIENWAA
jgi:tRNA(fMet)-specific endonuclease VapC